MALEAWGHARFERGDPPEDILADVLGPAGSPAAYLLVAIDLIISHWPETKTVAIPFLACPELLSIDGERQTHDRMPEIDVFGFGAIGPKEPAGVARLEDLAKRPSRRFALEALLGTFALDDDGRDTLRDLLTKAAVRLGEPQPEDTFADPRFMARYALNVIDPANWKETSQGPAYVSPPDEAQHLEALQRDRATQTLDFGIDAALQNALEHPDQSGPELATQAILYAKRLQAAPSEDEDAMRSRTHTVVSAALIVARDSTDAMLDMHEPWVRSVIDDAFTGEDHVATSTFREGVRFNPGAIATLSLIHLWHRGRGDARLALLELAGRADASAARGVGSGLSHVRALERRLIPALLRCALRAQVRVDHRWDTPEEEEKVAASDRHRLQVADAIAAEGAWLLEGKPEPAWPELPSRSIHRRRTLTIGPSQRAPSPPPNNPRPAERLRSQVAAVWLRQLTRDLDPEDQAWVKGFVEAYALWTAEANGAGLERRAEIVGGRDGWNDVFFPLVAEACAHVPRDEATMIIAAAIDVPDESFFDIAEELVRTHPA